MNQSIERTWRHWDQSRTRAAIQDPVGVLAPLLTMAGLTLLLWRSHKAGARVAAQPQGRGV